jgi:membrane protein required for colicin V production
MVWVDYAIIIVIALSTLISLTRGFVREAFSLAIWIAAFFVASWFYQDLAVYFTSFTDSTVRNGLAALILFVLTLIVGALVNFLLGKLVDGTGLTGTDRVLGLVFGAARGVLIVTLVLFAVDSFTALSTSDWWQQSQLIPHFAVFVQWFFEFLESNSSFLPQQA